MADWKQLALAGWVGGRKPRVGVSCHLGLHGWHAGHDMLIHTLKIQGRRALLKYGFSF